MHEVITLVNRHVPVPAKLHRRRLWAYVGQTFKFCLGVYLTIERQRDGDDRRLVLNFRHDLGSGVLPHDQLLRIGEVSIVPRALALRDDVPVALMLELAAEPCALYRAIEAAA